MIELVTAPLSIPIPDSPVIHKTTWHVTPIHPDLTVTVDDLDIPVWLVGKATLDPLPPLPATLADADGDGLQLSIAPATSDPVPFDKVLDSAHAPVAWNGGTPICVVRLDPHSPGDYQLFATRTDGSLRVLTPEHSQARITAFAGALPVG